MQRFWAVFGAASIRVKVMGIVLGVIVLLGLFVTFQLRFALYETLETQLYSQGLGISDSLASRVAQLAEAGDVPALVEYLQGTKEHYSAGGHNTLVDYIALRQPDGAIVASSPDAPLPPEIASTLPIDPVQRTRKLSTPWGDVIDVVTPLADGQILQLGLAEDTIEAITNTVTVQIWSITLVMVVVGFLAAFFLTWILTRPILSLVDATRAVASGDFSRQVTRWANDEIGDLAEAFNVMTRSLARAAKLSSERESLRQHYIRGVITAQEDERKRIARELHDSTSQSLTSLLVGLRNLEESPDLNTLHSRIEDIRKVVNHTLDEVHALAWQLRPNVLDDLGLEAALGRYIDDYQRRYGIQVDFVARGLDERLPPALETSLYRMIQEGLTNIARHAQAKNASVLLEQRLTVIRVIIEDNGVGFDADAQSYSQKSLGLQGIRERTQLFGGKLIIESQPGAGASLFIEIPLTPVPEMETR
ncbi:MAG: HAMP domain-containing protein [Chloroflexi bacterium]|nr:HAMP domain-containing protein [Chloroflexota bacterium]